MKILVFENGEAGRLTDIPGENVQGEIEELLGGEIQTRRMAGDLFLVSRAMPEHEKEKLPKWYAAKRSGDPYEHYVYGNCVVMRISNTGVAKDVTKRDAENVSFYLRRVEG